MKNERDEQQFKHDQYRAQADGHLNQYTDKMHRAVADILGRITPDDTTMRLNVQSLALAHITEGVKLMIGMGMEDDEISQLASKAAYHARSQNRLARGEIEAEAAEQAHSDMLDALADAHLNYEQQPQAGVDPDAPKVEPAPQAIDQSQPAAPAAPAVPSQVTGTTPSPANSPQDKLAQESMANGGQVSQETQDAQPGSQSTDLDQQKADAATGTTKEQLAVEDTIDGEVKKADDNDPKAKAAAAARASAANAAS